MLEAIVVAAIVSGATAYAAWTLLPPLRRLFGARADAGCGSGCNGCGPALPAAAERPIRIVRIGRSAGPGARRAPTAAQLPTSPDRIA